MNFKIEILVQFFECKWKFYRKYQVFSDRSVCTRPNRFWTVRLRPRVLKNDPGSIVLRTSSGPWIHRRKFYFLRNFLKIYVFFYFEIRKFLHTVLIFSMTTFFDAQPKTGHLQILPSPKSIILVKNRMFLENYF